MKERCVDAGVIVKLVFKGEPYRAIARRLVLESIAARINLIAPPFFVSEVDTAVRKRVYDGILNPGAAQKAYMVLDQAPVTVMTHPGLRQRAREIAEQFNQRTVYDASYAALAELRGCEFWTADRIFYEAVGSTLLYVRYLPHYP